MELVRAVPVLLLAVGIGCLAWASATGSAAAGVFVIFPFVVGTGPVALLGALMIVAGLLTLPFAFAARAVPAPTVGPPNAGSDRNGSGGVVLVGPVPIFFGAWGSPPRWAYWAAVAAGSVLLLVVALWEWSLLR